jgi:hypothetical protein
MIGGPLLPFFSSTRWRNLFFPLSILGGKKARGVREWDGVRRYPSKESMKWVREKEYRK